MSKLGRNCPSQDNSDTEVEVDPDADKSARYNDDGAVSRTITVAELRELMRDAARQRPTTAPLTHTDDGSIPLDGRWLSNQEISTWRTDIGKIDVLMNIPAATAP